MVEIQIKNLSILTNNGKRKFEYSGNFSCGNKIAIMGASGCGKSTFLKVIANLISQLNSNNLVVKYDSISRITSKNEYAYLPQESKDIVRPWYKVNKQVNFDSANKLGIQNIMERYPRDLSGGELRRVAIGHIMSLSNKKIYLLDEPFNGLDEDIRKMAISYVLEKISNDAILIFVTHYIEEAKMMDANILNMNSYAS